MMTRTLIAIALLAAASSAVDIDPAVLASSAVDIDPAVLEPLKTLLAGLNLTDPNSAFEFASSSAGQDALGKLLTVAGLQNDHGVDLSPIDPTGSNDPADQLKLRLFTEASYTQQ